MYLTLKGCTGYLGHPFLHREHRGVHEEQGRGFSCREGCFSRLFPVADSAKQEAGLPTDLVPRACVRHSLLPCEQGKRKKTCPRPDRNLGHDRGTDRNRRASDYPQEAQCDRQTRAASQASLERIFVSSWIVVRIFNLQSLAASDIKQTSISTNQDGEGCLIKQCILT